MFEKTTQIISHKIDLKLFEKRFKYKMPISEEMGEEHFFKYFMKEIKNQYSSKVIGENNDGDSNCTIREKRRLELNVEEMERLRNNSSSVIMFSSLIAYVMTIITVLAHNYMLTLTIMFDKTKTMAKPEEINEITTICRDGALEINHIILDAFLCFFIMFVIIAITCQLRNWNIERKIRFNKVCIDALNEIEAEEN